MSYTQRRIPVVVEVGPPATSGAATFVIEPRLVGEHSYLTGTLTVSARDLKVRILTLDNKTILVSEEPDRLPDDAARGRRLDATLTLRCPAGQVPLPTDLSAVLTAASTELSWVDPREQAYLLAFLAEARDTGIRQARIALICESLAAAAARSPVQGRS